MLNMGVFGVANLSSEFRSTQPTLLKIRVIRVICNSDNYRQNTHNARGVEKEVTVTHQLEKPIFQVRHRRKTWGKVKGAGELIDWKWKKIDAKIEGLLNLG